MAERTRGAGRWMPFFAAFALMGSMVVAPKPPAFAHGEAADEPFLKNMTTAFFNVSVTPTAIEVGEPVKVTGSVKILETWPHTLETPEIAAIMPVVPGPVFALRERFVNGEAAIGSFFVEKGGIYEFEMELVGKEPGNWHVHPGIAVYGTGTLIGPGEWVTVRQGEKPFSFPLTLVSGETIELGEYGGQFAWWWSFAGFVLGVGWILYWTSNKPTVTNLAVTSQLPVNDDAPDIGLITPRDHMWMNVFAGVTLILLIVGWTYATSNAPVRWPQQTDWFTPSAISSGANLAEVRTKGATYDEASETLTMQVGVTNRSEAEIQVKQLIMGMATFVNGSANEQAAAGPQDFVDRLEVEPNVPLAPGETKDLTLTVSSPIFGVERLIPTDSPQQFIGAVLRFEDTGAAHELVTVRSSVVPTQFRSAYLP